MKIQSYYIFEGKKGKRKEIFSLIEEEILNVFYKNYPKNEGWKLSFIKHKSGSTCDRGICIYKNEVAISTFIWAFQCSRLLSKKEHFGKYVYGIHFIHMSEITGKYDYKDVEKPYMFSDEDIKRWIELIFEKGKILPEERVAFFYNSDWKFFDCPE